MSTGAANTSSPALEMVRAIYAETRDWYKVAEAKAQLLLTLDGLVVGALVGLLFSTPQDFSDFIEAMPDFALLLLSGSAAAFLVSIIYAVRCVLSRLYTEHELDETTGPFRRTHPLYQNIWFFQHYTRHDPSDVLAMISADPEAEARAMLANLEALAANVTKKHRLVNRGFVAAGTGLTLLLLTALTYGAFVAAGTGEAIQGRPAGACIEPPLCA